MKLSENQKNVFYISLTVFLGLCFGIVVFFIVQHFRNKNTNNCIRKCNGKNCGDDGCKGSCGTCPSGQTCGQDGKCTGCTPNCDGTCKEDDGCGNTCQGTCPSGQTCGQDGKCTGCTPKCDGTCKEDDGCGNPCQDTCQSGQTCISGKCTPNTPDTCYGKNQDPFGPPGACSQNRLKCCNNLQFCFNNKTNGYVCRDQKVDGDICKGDQGFKYPDCTKILGCTGSSQFCPHTACPDECKGRNCGANCKACSDCPIGTTCDPNWNVCVPPNCNDPKSLPCPSGFSCSPKNCVPN